MNDDLISRQAAIELIKNNSYTIIHNLNDVEKGMTLYGIIQALEYLPSVQQKTGHWIEEAGDLRCSGCEFLITDEYYLGKGVACPNCGARMKGETE